MVPKSPNLIQNISINKGVSGRLQTKGFEIPVYVWSWENSRPCNREEKQLVRLSAVNSRDHEPSEGQVLGNCAALATDRFKGKGEIRNTEWDRYL